MGLLTRRLLRSVAEVEIGAEGGPSRKEAAGAFSRYTAHRRAWASWAGPVSRRRERAVLLFHRACSRLLASALTGLSLSLPLSPPLFLPIVSPLFLRDPPSFPLFLLVTQ